jgi:anti-sigma-K factor RskA
MATNTPPLDEQNQRDTQSALYALGGLSAQERLEVESELSKDVKLKNAVRLAEQITEQLATQSAVNPSPSLRPRLLERVLGTAPSSAIILELNKRVQRVRKYAVAASLVATIGLGTTVYYQQTRSSVLTQLEATQSELSELTRKQSVLADKAGQFDERNSVLSSAIANGTLQEIKLRTAKPNDPLLAKAETVIYWNKSQQTVYLEVRSLPDNAQNTDYQLWALVGNKPTNLGVFNTSDSALLFKKMNDVTSADAFAITLEPKGGKPSPTLENLTVIGTTQSN